MNDYFDFIEKIAKVWEFFAALSATFAGAFVWLWRKYSKRGARINRLENEQKGIREDITMIVGKVGTLDTNVKLLTDQMAAIVEDAHDKFVTQKDFDDSINRFDKTIMDGFSEMRRQIFDLAREKRGQ